MDIAALKQKHPRKTQSVEVEGDQYQIVELTLAERTRFIDLMNEEGPSQGTLFAIQRGVPAFVDMSVDDMESISPGFIDTLAGEVFKLSGMQPQEETEKNS